MMNTSIRYAHELHNANWAYVTASNIFKIINNNNNNYSHLSNVIFVIGQFTFPDSLLAELINGMMYHTNPITRILCRIREI